MTLINAEINKGLYEGVIDSAFAVGVWGLSRFNCVQKLCKLFVGIMILPWNAVGTSISFNNL